MAANDSNSSPPALGGAAPARETERPGKSQANPEETTASSGEAAHISELMRSLRALASDSPERQAYLEEIARSVAHGTYKVDAEATASGIIDDACNSVGRSSDAAFAAASGDTASGNPEPDTSAAEAAG